MSVEQAYVYSKVYDKSIKDPAIQDFLTSLINLFTSTRVIVMPLEERKKLIKLLNSIFFSDDANGQIAQNAIYKDFLIKLMEMVQHNKLTRSQLELLRDNLTYIEESRITGFIPYSHHSTKFISNSHIIELIQDILRKNNIPNTSTEHAQSFTKVESLGNKLHSHLNKLHMAHPTPHYGKSIKTKKSPQKNKPYARPPCPYGTSCYRQKNPLHTTEFSHPSEGGKRTSKKIYRCVRQTLKKYTSRSSPPYPAQECPYAKKKGNDGRTYISKPNDSNGIFRWVLQH
jgi:PBZ domain